MARTKNDLVRGLKGAIGKSIVYKTRRDGKTFASKYPDMSKVVASKEQTKYRDLFGKAVRFAAELKKDPERLAAFRVRKGESVYLAAIREYMHLNGKSATPRSRYKGIWQERLRKENLTERQMKTALYIEQTGLLTNGDCQRLHHISKATATRDLQELARKNIIASTHIKGPGARYIKGSWWAQNSYIS